MEFIILIRPYFTTRNNQESGKRANERKFEVRTVGGRVSRARHQVVRSPERNLRKSSHGRGTNLPAESSEFRGKVGSIGDADPNRLAPTLCTNLFRRSDRGRPLFTAADELERDSQETFLPRFLFFTYSFLVYSSKPKRMRIPYYTSRSTQKNRYFTNPPNFVLIPANNVYVT